MRTVVLFGAALISSTVHAQQDYPTRPIRYVVPFAPGGPTDIMSRAFAEKIGAAWGQQVVVDNRGGAGGSLGAEVVARSAPDGYTVMIGHVGTHAINVSLYQKVGYDPVKDFQPISLLATLPFVLVVYNGFPPRSVKELLALARAKPGSINYASAGSGGPTHLAGALFKSSAAIDIVHVPYKGNAAALTELAGGQVQMMFSNMLTAMPHVRTGRLRALAVSPAKRTPQAPDLPTVAESGVPGFDVTPWYGVLAPAGLPAPLVAKWNREIVRIVPLPDMREKFVAQGIDLASSTPAEFSALIKSEIPKWRKVVKDTGAKAD